MFAALPTPLFQKSVVVLHTNYYHEVKFSQISRFLSSNMLFKLFVHYKVELIISISKKIEKAICNFIKFYIKLKVFEAEWSAKMFGIIILGIQALPH